MRTAARTADLYPGTGPRHHASGPGESASASGSDRREGQEQRIEELEDKLHQMKMREVIYKRLCEEARFLVARSNNEAFVRRWFSDYKSIHE